MASMASTASTASTGSTATMASTASTASAATASASRSSASWPSCRRRVAAPTEFASRSLAMRQSFSELSQGSLEELTAEVLSSADLAANKFHELIHTEEAYVAGARWRWSSRPAEKLAFLRREERDAIFSNVEALLQCNEALLEMLQKDGDPVAVWANAFLSVAPFSLYSLYRQNYPRAIELVHSMKGARSASPSTSSRSGRSCPSATASSMTS